jgi:ATP-dependent RNA helicase SUPV3L1/SUV3
MASGSIPPFLTDLTQPANWFPAARAMRRTIIAHLGPTNSGKTHAALEALSRADGGAYCGPLRLLAAEVADRLNGAGVACHLVTGQEQRQVPGARHTASTVEMAVLDRELAVRGAGAAACRLWAEVEQQPMDHAQHVFGQQCRVPAPPKPASRLPGWRVRPQVAVVDEVQMLADPARGAAWTRALLGLPAAQLHVCGDPAVLPLLQALAAQCGDDLQVRARGRRAGAAAGAYAGWLCCSWLPACLHPSPRFHGLCAAPRLPQVVTWRPPVTRCLQVLRYKRLSPLVVAGGPVDLQDVSPGDCVLAFSRRHLHRLRRELEAAGARPAMVYGALPPDARRAQAALFNDPESAANTLVASDAVGEGHCLHSSCTHCLA